MKLRNYFFFTSVCIFAISSIKPMCTEVLIEGKAGYFWPENHRFRDVYGSGGVYGLEISSQACQGLGLYPWVSVDYFRKDGTSNGLHYKTQITLVPVCVGLKWLFPISVGNVYLGLGANGTYIDIKDHSPFVIQKSHKWEPGGIGKLGIIFNLRKHVFLDFFASYTYLRGHFNYTDGIAIYRNNIDLSHVIAGVGLGFRLGNSEKKSKKQEKHQTQEIPQKETPEPSQFFPLF